MDAETQVWDNDLFIFEREVRPILDVLADKTLEQSLLELEEECELQNMKDFCHEQKRVRAERDHELQAQVKLEKKRETWAREVVRNQMSFYENKISCTNKALCLHTSKA